MSPQPVPGAEDFTQESVYRAVRKDVLQHPLTILPAAVSVLGMLSASLFGPDPTTVAVVFGSAVLATGSWIYNYFIRGEALAQRHVDKLRARRERHYHREVESLETEWNQTGLPEGVQQARELREAYQKLEAFLRGRLEEARRTGKEAGGFNVQRLLVLAEDTYREGAAILRSALTTYQALQQIDHDKLRSELAGWNEELSAVRQATESGPRVESLETRIASHERRLQLFRQRVESVDRLFAESEALEAALESTYLEAVDLESPDNLLGRGQAASSLERAVAAARKVEDRLRAMEQPNPDDDIYLAASEK